MKFFDRSTKELVYYFKVIEIHKNNMNEYIVIENGNGDKMTFNLKTSNVIHENIILMPQKCSKENVVLCFTVDSNIKVIREELNLIW